MRLNMSFPLRERGLKYIEDRKMHVPNFVVPLAGTWIEIAPVILFTAVTVVVPLAGTWIEIIIIPAIRTEDGCRSP